VIPSALQSAVLELRRMWRLEPFLLATSAILGVLAGAGIVLAQPDTTPILSREYTLTTPRGPRVLLLGPRIPVNPPDVGYHGEVMAAADPESDDNLIVCGYRANMRTGSGYEGYVYQSDDQGKTWHETLVDAQSQWVSEESCSFGPAHQAYFATGVSDTSRGEPHHEYGNLHLYRSSDGGRTWQTMLVNRFMDYTSMAVDSTLGQQQGTLYLFANTPVDGTAGAWRMMDKAPYLAAFRNGPELSFSVTSGTFNSGERGVRRPGKYPAASAVLRDGTVLAVFPGDGEPADHGSGKDTRVFSVEVGISRDGGKTLNKSTVYESVDPAVATGLAVDQATDKVYVCWTPRYRNNVGSRLMLGTSSNQGRSWSVKPVKVLNAATLDLRVGSVSLATNKDGVLGFMWYGRNADRVYFGASFDGGDSIAAVFPLTPNPPMQFERGEARADERRLFVYPPVWKNSSHRLEPLRILLFGPDPWGVPFGNALVADHSGVFHPVWSEVANGATHLWTRAILLQVRDEGVSALTTNGLTDISDKVVWHVSEVRYDHLSNLVAFDITVTNKSEATIGGPILVVLASDGGLPDLSADNADNGELGEGALWKLRTPSDGLECEQSTRPRTLTFRTFLRREDVLADNKLLSVALKVFGKPPKE